MDIKYKGMTVNERLYLSGLLDKFEKAIHEKDISKVRKVLTEVELTQPDIDDILKKHNLIE